MARLFWLTLIAAFAAALLAGASWAAALFAVGTLLGSPPPEMGTQSTVLLWQGAPELRGHPSGGVGPFETGRELRPPTRRLVSRGGTHAGGRGAPGAAPRTGPGPATLSANALGPTTPLDRRAAPCERRQPAGALALPLRR